MIRQLLMALGVMSLELGYQGISLALNCPSYPEQSNKTLQVEAEAAVAKLKYVSGAEGKVTIKHSTQDLLEKLPNADTVYLESMFYTGICSSIQADKLLTDSQKTQRLNEYIAVVHKYLKPPPPKTSSSSKQLDKKKEGTPPPAVSPPVSPPPQVAAKPPEAQCNGQSTEGLLRRPEVFFQSWRNAVISLHKKQYVVEMKDVIGMQSRIRDNFPKFLIPEATFTLTCMEKNGEVRLEKLGTETYDNVRYENQKIIF